MRKIDKKEYIELVNNTEVIEADSFGVKVLKYPNGNYMKLFRRKRFFSSALFYPYWFRFVWHAWALKLIGIPTLKSVVEIVKISHIKKSAVVYEPLPGSTVKQLLNENSFDDNLIRKLGDFVATLHNKGIYFSSLHLGNIVLTPEKEFGLIDISDMKFFYFVLPFFAIKSNMNYLFHSRQGLKYFNDEAKINAFISAYVESITKRNKKNISDFLTKQKNILNTL